MLGAINNTTKDFRIEGVLSRNEDTLKKFIITYIPIGSNVSTDGWTGYTFLNSLDSIIRILHTKWWRKVWTGNPIYFL